MTYVGKKPADIIATAVDTTTGTFSGDLTVDTNTLYVDSANNRVGVGTVSPSEVLEISKDDRANGATLRITNSASSSSWISGDIIGTIDFYSSDASDADVRSRIQSVSTGGATSPGAVDLTFSTFSSSTLEEKFRITSTGDVGIGTDSPLRQLSISNASNAEISFISGTSSNASILFGDGITGTDVYRGYIQYQHSIDAMLFATAVSERMRIDSSGNLLVGKTAESGNTAGHFFSSSGYQRSTRNGGIHIMNRITTDGSIIDFQKDGSAVGSISSNSGSRIVLSLGGNNNAGFTGASSSNAILPTLAGSTDDNTVDLGASSVRYNDLYLGGGVYLGGTGSANLLDDYEEGTWTPGVSDGTNTGSLSAINAFYTKIGQVVHIRAALLNLNTSGMTAGAALQITGLPFAPSSTTNSETYIPIATNLITTTKGICAELDNGSTNLRFLEQDEAKSGSFITVSAATSGNADVFLSFTYNVG